MPRPRLMAWAGALAACSAYHASRQRTRLIPPSTKLTDAAAADRYYERRYAVAHLNERGDAGRFFELPDAVKAMVPTRQATRSYSRLFFECRTHKTHLAKRCNTYDGDILLLCLSRRSYSNST